MSTEAATEVATKPADTFPQGARVDFSGVRDASKPTTDVSRTLMRGSWYMIEGLLQKTEPVSSPDAQRKGNRLWAKIRKLNPCKVNIGKPDQIDLEKVHIRSENQTDIAWQSLLAERNEMFDAWKREPLTIVLSKKTNDLLEHTYIKWALKNRDKVWAEASEFSLDILDSFDVGNDDDEDSDK